MNDAELLAAAPDTISIAGVFKATPRTEGGKRFLFCEASNEGTDLQNETIVAKALQESADYYLRYGNVDIEHFTKIGPRLGIPDSATYEIGQPKEVRPSGNQTFVKCEIYSGNGPAAEKANQFWSSLTDCHPPARWYASVGGQALNKAVEVDPKTQSRRVIIKSLRWHNIGMSKTPVNQHVDACATVPVGAFAKCWTPGGFDITKALTAGYGTDSAALTGGGSLREQSLQGKPLNYFDYREQISKAIRDGKLGTPCAQSIKEFSERAFGMGPDEAAEHTERFMLDLRNRIKRGT